MGKVDGINPSVDMNVFNGTLDQLYKFAGTQPSSQPPVAQPSKTHTIVSGDTFNSVANKYGVTVTDLANANNQLLKAARN
jgi:LysM repeat protein